MQRLSVIFFLVFLACTAKTQVLFKTTVQTQTVEVGSPFFVEYLLEKVEENDGFTPPLFSGLRLVSGPNVYNAKVPGPDGVKMVKNYVFTLVATRPGKYTIPGASANVNGRFIRSNDEVIEVVEKTDRSGNNISEYFLQPGEDPYKKMRRNLFMKVMVNKRSCYIGEPVVATFKLYSRLQSKSDIVKNPGFYGFSVQDIISLDDRVSEVETINGKTFDVHTVRTVQLYPLQAGIFMIDPMEVMNKVEFSRSIVNKKTEQEIYEGVFDNRADGSSDDNTVTYENSISTEKVAIHVKPYPERNKPPSFAGATGHFTITAFLDNNNLARNERGDLIITIAGKGNFTQLSAPVIQWPAGVEGFEPVVRDTLDKTGVPLEGARTFRFPFVAARAGQYTLPPVSFAFFDTDSNNYKTTSTEPVEINILDKGKKDVAQALPATTKNNTRPVALWVAGATLLLLLSAGAWWFYKKRKSHVYIPPAEIKAVPAVEELLKPARIAAGMDDNSFYVILQKLVWDELGSALHLAGSRMNKQNLRQALQLKQFPGHLSQAIFSILQECETAAYTRADFTHNKQELLKKAKDILEQVRLHQ